MFSPGWCSADPLLSYPGSRHVHHCDLRGAFVRAIPPHPNRFSFIAHRVRGLAFLRCGDRCRGIRGMNLASTSPSGTRYRALRSQRSSGRGCGAYARVGVRRARSTWSATADDAQTFHDHLTTFPRDSITRRASVPRRATARASEVDKPRSRHCRPRGRPPAAGLRTERGPGILSVGIRGARVGDALRREACRAGDRGVEILAYTRSGQLALRTAHFLALFHDSDNGGVFASSASSSISRCCPAAREFGIHLKTRYLSTGPAEHCAAPEVHLEQVLNTRKRRSRGLCSRR